MMKIILLKRGFGLVRNTLPKAWVYGRKIADWVDDYWDVEFKNQEHLMLEDIDRLEKRMDRLFLGRNCKN